MSARRPAAGHEAPARYFVVMLSHGPAWDVARPLEGQQAWTDHAAFMDGLVEDGFVVLGGPLEGASGALLIVRATRQADVEPRLAADPWAQLDLLRTISVTPWTLRLGGLKGPEQ